MNRIYNWLKYVSHDFVVLLIVSKKVSIFLIDAAHQQGIKRGLHCLPCECEGRQEMVIKMNQL